MTVSPLAPTAFADLPVIDGVTFASTAAGIKYANRDDVMLAVLTAGTAVAGVFTQSATRSANVLDCQKKIGTISTEAAAIIVNSGNSNALQDGTVKEALAQSAQASPTSQESPPNGYSPLQPAFSVNGCHTTGSHRN